MAHALAAIVGLMFLLSGVSKALHSGPFLNHIQELGWVPTVLAPVVCVFMTGLELGLATALLLFVSPSTTLLVALSTLGVLTLVTLQGYLRGAIEHCGCYGRWLPLTPQQSVGLNILLGALLVVAWVVLDSAQVPVTDLRAPLLAVALGVFMAGRSGDSPLIDMAPTKVGQSWDSDWVDGIGLPAGLPTLIAFVNPKCKLCMNWTQPLKQISQKNQWPLHIVVSESQLAHAQELLTPGFTIHSVSVRELVWLVDTVPSVLQIRDGVIEARWTGKVPRAWRPKGEDCSRALAV